MSYNRSAYYVAKLQVKQSRTKTKACHVGKTYYNRLIDWARFYVPPSGPPHHAHNNTTMQYETKKYTKYTQMNTNKSIYVR